MIDTTNYTITLDRSELCDLMLACTGIVIDARIEMESDPDCPQYRREHVLPGTIKKWQRLRDLIEVQLDQIDKERGMDW